MGMGMPNIKFFKLIKKKTVFLGCDGRDQSFLILLKKNSPFSVISAEDPVHFFTDPDPALRKKDPHTLLDIIKKDHIT